MQGAVYLIQPQEFAESNTFKIGMTKRNDGSRISSYGQKSSILRVVECSNPKNVEDELIEVFNNKFSLSKGKEYFSGDKNDMIECFNKCVLSKAKNVEECKIYVENAIEELQTMIDNPSTDVDVINGFINRLYDNIGVNKEQRDRLDELSTMQGFKINASIELKFFGIIAMNQRGGKVRRILSHQDLLPPTKPSDPLDESIGLIEESPYCKVISNTKSIKLTSSRTYWITWVGLFKMLTRSFQQPQYSNYFAIQNQIHSMILRNLRASG